MKKKKSLWIRILSCLMIFCTSFLFAGCMGGSADENEELEEEMGDEFDEEGGLFGELDFDMYGAKVLYRPDNYDYNTGSGGTAENPNDYYGQYAWVILNALYQTYGVVDSQLAPHYLGLDLTNTDDQNQYNKMLPYLYDSIRYQVNKVATVKKDKDGQVLAEEDQYVVIGANLSNQWNWAFNYDWTGLESPLLTGEYAISNDNFLYNSNYTTTTEFENAIASHYTSNKELNINYREIYLGASTQTDYDNYSPYVKTLEYAIYSYALDLEPAQVDVTLNSSGTSAYSVKINNISVDESLNNIKELFNKAGSFVGLTERQASKLKKWILNNVIGSAAQDDLTIYDEAIEKQDADGNVTGYEFVGNGTTTNLGRDYEKAVDRIVEGVCKEVPIGSSDDDGDGKLDDEFLASEIMEYAGNTFMIQDDDNFPAEEIANSSKYYIRPLEYQSVTLMLKDETTIDGMYIALKYDADGQGTEDGVWDTNQYLDIIVELNYFSYADKKMYTVGSQQTRVYDGPFDISNNSLGMYEDMGNVYFYDWGKCEDSGIKNHLDEDECLVVGEFNTEIGNKALMTDVGLEGGYNKAPLISNNPLVLVGTSPARRYYSLIEPSADEDLGGKTYVTGRLNPEKFKGSDGCDYIEITYKVLKDHASDTSKNYKFYTGIAFIY